MTHSTKISNRTFLATVEDGCRRPVRVAALGALLGLAFALLPSGVSATLPPGEAFDEAAQEAVADAVSPTERAAAAAEDPAPEGSDSQPAPSRRGEQPRDWLTRGDSVVIPAGEVVKDVVVFGGSAVIGENAEVQGDVVVFGGSVVVESGVRVDGDLVAFGGSVKVEPRVRVSGDAVVLGGSITLADMSEVRGDAVTLGGSVTTEGSATVQGSRVSMGLGRAIQEAAGRRGFEAGARRHRAGMPRPLRVIATFLAVFAVGLVLLPVMPRRMPRLSRTVTNKLPMSLLAGFLTFVAFVPIVVLLLVTVLGILLIPLVFVGYGVITFVGWAAAALALGQWLPSGDKRSSIASLALGTAAFCLLGLLSLVPVAGFASSIVLMAGTFAGVGAVVISRFGQRDFDEAPSYRPSGETAQQGEPVTP